MMCKKQTLLLGHRGARGEAPENTLLGFQYTQQLGIDGIEFDVQLSKDGKLVVFHDNTLNRCVGRQGWIDQLTSHALTSMVQSKLLQGFPALPNAHNTLTRISLLADVLPYLKGYIYIELEIKTHARTNHEALANALVAELADIDSLLPIRITSFDTKLHQHMQRKGFQLERGLITQRLLNTPADTNALINTAKRLGCVGIAMHYPQITKEIVQRMHAAKLSTTAWTVNDTTWVEQLRDWDVGAIITDYPSKFLATNQ